MIRKHVEDKYRCCVDVVVEGGGGEHHKCLHKAEESMTHQRSKSLFPETQQLRQIPTPLSRGSILADILIVEVVWNNR
jgi:hypothetical protein